jgi:hypothetical protein
MRGAKGANLYIDRPHSRVPSAVAINHPGNTFMEQGVEVTDALSLYFHVAKNLSEQQFYFLL